jgi:hypothetical protein
MAQNLRTLAEIAKSGELRVKFFGIWQIRVSTVRMELNCNFLEQAFAIFSDLNI